MSELPSGTVTFLFSDIEGSTRLAQELRDGYPPLLAEHRRLINEAVAAAGGDVFGSEGDALFAAFDAPTSAIRAAAQAQRALADHRWPAGGEVRVRMGVHSGEATVVGDNYVGLTLHQVARVMNAGHGGQVLVSATTRELVGDEPGDGLSLRDLGEHRLKDLAEPVRLYQLVGDGLANDFPKLRTLSARPNNLPVQLTSFVGREELADARRALAATRLLTLTGPGGTGKTRLALQLAADVLPQFPDGVWFVALEAVTDPELVPSVIATTVGVVDTSGRPPLEALVEHLRDRHVLLVLDNFEQVVDAAPTIGQLLRELPELKVIVTSRILLRVYGEHELPVPPLGLPKVETTGGAPVGAATAARSEAVRLFVERARAVQPAFELTDDNAATVVDIVARLDGLPLAIELAAARLRILSVDAIRARLDKRLSLLTGGSRDLPARQQTLRGAIDWSYEILDDAEKRLFRRFSVFAGGAFLPEAENVCGSADLGIDILDGLSSLSDKSLLRAALTAVEDPRFTMLATIREYAAAQLEATEDAEDLRARHAESFAALVERCADELTGSEGKMWQDRLELDHDNLRAALDWAVAAGRTAIAMRMIAGLWRFWQTRGHLVEARRRTDEVLAMPGVDDEPALLRAKAYAAGGSIRYWQGDWVGANGYYGKALEAARETGDKRELALALYNYGFAALDWEAETQDERYRGGKPYYEQALELYHEIGDEKGVADAHWALAIAAASTGDSEGARKHSEQALEVYRRLDDPFGIGWGAHMLALYLLTDGRLDEARRLSTEALTTFAKSNDSSGIVLAAYNVSLIAGRAGRRERALRIAGAVDALGRSFGLGVIGQSFQFLDWRMPVAPEDEEGLRYWNEGAQWSLEQLADYALGDVEPALAANAAAGG